MPRRKTTLRMWLNQETTAGYFFAAPFIIGFVVFIVVPMLMSLYFSFCDYNILSPAKWTGFENFKNGKNRSGLPPGFCSGDSKACMAGRDPSAFREKRDSNRQ